MNATEFTFYGPQCDESLKAAARFAGLQIQCPACQHLIHTPNLPAGTGFTDVRPESGHTWDTFLPNGKKAWSGRRVSYAG